MCPETDRLGGTDLTLNRWGPERFSQLPESHSRAVGVLGWHPGGSLRVRTVTCSASEDFMFYLELGGSWEKLLI